jgi:hypothetical protein
MASEMRIVMTRASMFPPTEERHAYASASMAPVSTVPSFQYSSVRLFHHSLRRSIRAPTGRKSRTNRAKQSQFAGGQTNDKPCLYGELWEKTPGCASAKTKPICRGGGWWAQPTLHEGLRRHCAKQSQFAEPGLLRRCASRNDRKGRGARRAKQSQFAAGRIDANCF